MQDPPPDLKVKGKSRSLVGVKLALGLLALLAFLPARAPAASPAEVQLILTLDSSGSMRHNDPRRLMPQAAGIMATLLEPQDYLGLISFADDSRLRLAPAPLLPRQRRRAKRELARLYPRGRYTDIYGALAAALTAFDPEGPRRRALLLLLGGRPDLAPHKGRSEDSVARVHQEIIPAYRQAGIPIYAVAFTPESDQALLKALAEATGGRFLFIESPDELHLAFIRIYEELKGPQLAPLRDNQFLLDPGVNEAVLVLTRAIPGRPVTLENPQGRKIRPWNPPWPIDWLSAPGFDLVTLPHPQPGAWTVSGHKPGDSKVVLYTALKLESPLVPERLGEDEALVAGAVLTDNGKVISDPEILGRTEFTAILKGAGGNKPLFLSLTAPGAAAAPVWPPGVRVGEFPAMTGPGPRELTVLARGKDFRRERTFFINAAPPWYRASLKPGKPGAPTRLILQPDPARPLGELTGWLGVKRPSGALSGTFLTLKPGEGGEFAFVPDEPGRYLAMWRLAGITPSGRSVVLNPPALPLNFSSLQVAPAPSGGLFPRPWIVLALMLTALFLLALGGALLKRRHSP